MNRGDDTEKKTCFTNELMDELSRYFTSFYPQNLEKVGIKFGQISMFVVKLKNKKIEIRHFLTAGKVVDLLKEPNFLPSQLSSRGQARLSN